MKGSNRRMASSPLDRPREPPSRERFADLVEPLLRPLVGLARRILRSDDLAWDAVQEALCSLWREAVLPPNPRAWLIRAVVFRSLALARSRSRRRKHEFLACREHPEATRRDDPAILLEREDLLGMFQMALCAMAPEHREVIVRRAIEEMDYEAIASSLDIPVGTVRSRLNRSRKAFREALRRILPAEDQVLLAWVDEEKT